MPCVGARAARVCRAGCHRSDRPRPFGQLVGSASPTSESNRPRVRSRGVAHTPRFRTGVASTHEAFAPQPSRAAVAGIRREGRRQAQPPAADAHRLRRGAKRRGTRYLPPAKAPRAGRVLRGRAPRSSIEIGTSRAQQARPLTHSLADKPKRRASAVVAWTPCAARRWRATPRRPSRRSRSRRGSMTRRRCMRTTRTREGPRVRPCQRRCATTALAPTLGVASR
jgi:hypothetical protein